jgi:hypothetical protein
MFGVRSGWVGVLLGCVVCSRSVLGADSPEQLLATVRDGNRAAIQSIQTMECRYERVPWAGTSAEQAKKHFWLFPGRFWRSGDTYRLFESHDELDQIDREYVVRNGLILVHRKGRPNFQPCIFLSTLAPVNGTGGEMWQYLLFSHWGWVPPPGVSFYTLEEILQHRHVLHGAERLPSGQIRVELSHDGVKRQEFWFDPKVNYLVRKCVWVPAGDATLRWEHEVITFAESAPGVFVPTTVEVRCFVKGKQEAVIRTVISELKVNHALPADALRIPGIAGMNCIDLNRHMEYKVDAEGNRVGPERMVPVGIVVPAGSVRTGGPPVPPVPPCLEPLGGLPVPQDLPDGEPTAWWVWVLIVSAVILVIELDLGEIRRRAAQVFAGRTR